MGQVYLNSTSEVDYNVYLMQEVVYGPGVLELDVGGGRRHDLKAGTRSFRLAALTP